MNSKETCGNFLFSVHNILWDYEKVTLSGKHLLFGRISKDPALILLNSLENTQR